jgi:hypothetical protein
VRWVSSVRPPRPTRITTGDASRAPGTGGRAASGLRGRRGSQLELLKGEGKFTEAASGPRGRRGSQLVIARLHQDRRAVAMSGPQRPTRITTTWSASNSPAIWAASGPRPSRITTTPSGRRSARSSRCSVRSPTPARITTGQGGTAWRPYAAASGLRSRRGSQLPVHPPLPAGPPPQRPASEAAEVTTSERRRVHRRRRGSVQPPRLARITTPSGGWSYTATASAASGPEAGEDHNVFVVVTRTKEVMAQRPAAGAGRGSQHVDRDRPILRRHPEQRPAAEAGEDHNRGMPCMACKTSEAAVLSCDGAPVGSGPD